MNLFSSYNMMRFVFYFLCVFIFFYEHEFLEQIKEINNLYLK